MKTLFVLLLTLAPSLFSSTVVADRAVEELDIREATFRYQFANNASGQKQSAGAYYLATIVLGKEADPDEAFMKRFSDNKPPVKKVSDCTRSAASGVADKITGKRGLIFRIEGIKWISDTSVEAEGGYYEAGESASGNTYYLSKIDGKWKVQRNVMHWIA